VTEVCVLQEKSAPEENLRRKRSVDRKSSKVGIMDES
jgi:hypothetical protein